MHAGMQSFYTAIEHFRKCGETRYLAHGNFFFFQQDRCSACGNDVYALAFQRASKRSDAGFVRDGNESAANFHPGSGILRHSERIRGCNAVIEDNEARLSIPLQKLSGSATGSFDSAALRSE
jgi:hypothetical protein